MQLPNYDDINVDLSNVPQEAVVALFQGLDETKIEQALHDINELTETNLETKQAWAQVFAIMNSVLATAGRVVTIATL